MLILSGLINIINKETKNPKRIEPKYAKTCLTGVFLSVLNPIKHIMNKCETMIEIKLEIYTVRDNGSNGNKKIGIE